MEIKLEEIEYCKYHVDYVADKTKIDKKRDEVLDAFKNAPVKGFRSGKAPKDVLMYHYKSQVEESLKRAMCEEAYHDTLFEKQLKPIGSPAFQSMLLKDGKFYCKFTLDTKPKFDLQDYKGISTPRPQTKITQQELVDKRVLELRETFGDPSLYTSDDFVENGDRVIISYDCFDGDQKVEVLCKDSDVVKVGETLTRNFSDNLLGMKLNEQREFNYKVNDKSLPSLADKELTFKVTLTTGTKTKLAELDDSLAEKVGAKSLAELNAALERSANAMVAAEIKNQLNQAVSNVLVESHQFKVQDWLLEKEYSYLLKSSKLEDSSLSEEDKNMYKKLGEKNIRLSLILDRVREVEPEAQLSETEVLDILKSSLSRSGNFNSNEEFIEYLQKMGPYVQVLLAKIRDEYTLDFVSKHVRLVD